MNYQQLNHNDFASAHDLFEDALKFLKPPPRITPSQWSEQYRHLSEADREPGRYRLSRTPYVKGILDVLAPDSPYWKVAVMKSVQLGLTVAALNWIGYTIHLDPKPILAVYPKDEDVRKWLKNKFWPMLESTPVLRNKIAHPSNKSSGNTQSYMKFPGGYLVPTSAGSPRNFRSTSFCYVILDEVDAFVRLLGDDGDITELVDGRTTAFEGKGRKILYISTPLLQGRSMIERQFLLGDQRRYFVPCPYCGFEQVLQFDRVRWELNEDKHVIPDSIGYACTNCEKIIPEQCKSSMIEGGHWQATAKPQEPGFASFQINSLNSQFVSLEFLIYKYLESERDEEKKRTFQNQWMGETYREPLVAVADPHELRARAEDLQGKVPEGGLVLTCGVDVQKNALHYVIVAWGEGFEAWVLKYDSILGNPMESSVWRSLYRIIGQPWVSQADDAIQFSIAATFVDSGYLPDSVQKFTREYFKNRVIAVKGSTSYGRPIVGQLKRRYRQSQAFVMEIGTDTAKTQIYQSLQLQEPGENYVHFDEGLPKQFFEELTSEHQVVRGDRIRWEKKSNSTTLRNEGLDVMVYALAAAMYLNPDFTHIASKQEGSKPKVAAFADEVDYLEEWQT